MPYVMRNGQMVDVPQGYNPLQEVPGGILAAILANMGDTSKADPSLYDLSARNPAASPRLLNPDVNDFGIYTGAPIRGGLAGQTFGTGSEQEVANLMNQVAATRQPGYGLGAFRQPMTPQETSGQLQNPNLSDSARSQITTGSPGGVLAGRMNNIPASVEPSPIGPKGSYPSNPPLVDRPAPNPINPNTGTPRNEQAQARSNVIKGRNSAPSATVNEGGSTPTVGGYRLRRRL